MKKYQLYFLSIISGLFLALSWFPNAMVPLIFIGFVPLLLVESEIFKSPKSYRALTLFFCSFIAFFIWNIITTWWVKNASLGGGIMAIVCNTLLMTATFMMIHKVKKRLGEAWGGVLLISFWFSFEYFHISWDLTWPWLTLGNVFAGTPSWIQWYEYTGVFGGGLWILLVNYLVFTFFRNILSSGSNLMEQAKLEKVKLLGILALIILPIVFSITMTSFINDPTGKKVSVVIVQPNIDPYHEKFIVSYEEQLKQMLRLAAEKLDSTTIYLVFPETALTEFIWEGKLSNSKSVTIIRQFLKSYPNLNLIVGSSSAKVYHQGDTVSVTARKFIDADMYYDAFNTAFQFNNAKDVQVYHKSKLVPGVEKMPFPSVMKHFEDIAIDLGGTTGSLGTQEERSVFTSLDGTIKTAPVVCYESIYGEYVGEYVRNGAQFISIITNDGWWGDTPGYKQLLKYGALRAIETRRHVVRSANVGVACFINHKGEILQPTQYNVPAVLKGEITLSDELTFYARFGDYIAWAAIYISLTLLIYSWILSFISIKKRVNS